jgi:D-sedoheptulose 7-phosphate isomerase
MAQAKQNWLSNGTRPSYLTPMQQWISDYLQKQKTALDSIPVAEVAALVAGLREAVNADRQIFVFGNGGSAANASHFATDLGKGASDKIGRRFRVLSLNDNVSWLTALGNDYAYEDVFVRQLENYARPGDWALALSVSGNSPNVVKALAWAKEHQVRTVALVGAKRGRAAELAERTLVIDSEHYGRVEDAQMGICHLLCYAFMENPSAG